MQLSDELARTNMLTVALLAASVVAAPDPCQANLPDNVRALILTRFPGYVLPRLTDYDAADLKGESEYHHGDPCLFVESADVDGDGRREFAFLISREQGPTYLVVARRPAQKWSLERVFEITPDKAAGCCYVNVVPAGKYENVYGDSPHEPGERQSYTSHRPGFAAGMIGSTEIVFFRQHGRWIHVWVGD
jgi:hypothetical protein